MYKYSLSAFQNNQKSLTLRELKKIFESLVNFKRKKLVLIQTKFRILIKCQNSVSKIFLPNTKADFVVKTTVKDASPTLSIKHHKQKREGGHF